MNGIVSKDNLFVSPLDYDPKIVERHVPTTTIARPRTVDTFHPYRGNSGGTNNLNSKRGSGKLKLNNTTGTPKKKSSYKESLGDIRGTLGADSRSEYVSVFSDHDKRMPLDPSRRFYITDTPALPADPFLAKHMHADGPRGPDQLGSYMCKDQSARMKIVVANPQSDSVYDTDRDMFRKRPTGGEPCIYVYMCIYILLPVSVSVCVWVYLCSYISMFFSVHVHISVCLCLSIFRSPDLSLSECQTNTYIIILTIHSSGPI